VIERQLDLFVHDQAAALAEADERLRLYNAADRTDAEELYGDYVDELDGLSELLGEMRDTYAARLSDDDAQHYEREFDRAAQRRLSRFPLDLA
jgi:hypothetical protein